MLGLTAQSPNNFQKPCLCILALDVSGSMAGAPISELNMALQEFYQSINIDDEAAEKLEDIQEVAAEKLEEAKEVASGLWGKVKGIFGA